MENIKLSDEINKSNYYWRFEDYEIIFDLDTLLVEGTKSGKKLSDEEVIEVIKSYNLGLSLPDYDAKLIDVLIYAD